MFENLTARNALPPLNGLRAFEAMGRTGRATLAGAELGVTHSAVSRQVKALEATLGVRLFEGPKHRLRLTAKGRTLLAGLTTGFDALASAVKAARDQADLHLAVHPSLAVKWLIPRLATFERLHPGVALHLSELAPEATRQRGADLALRYVDAEALADPTVEVLTLNRIGLVCTPAVARSGLSHAARLTAGTRQSAWSDWTRASAQTAPAGPTRTLTHLHFVLDAALAGLGAAVLPCAIVADDVAAGRLVAPYGFVPDGGALAIIRLNGAADRNERALIRWLREQAQTPER